MKELYNLFSEPLQKWNTGKYFYNKMIFVIFFVNLDMYTMKNYLHPKLSASCLTYKDMFYDDETEKVCLLTLEEG